MTEARASDGRVAIVVVSHSAALATAAVELATAMTPGGAPHVAVAAGTGDDGGLGTDAAAVAEGIRAADEAADGAGVVVLMDLGSAVMSAEMALDLVEPRGPVVLSPAPFVEGLLGAVVQAAQGSSLERVLAEVDRAAGMKAAQLGP